MCERLRLAFRGERPQENGRLLGTEVKCHGSLSRAKKIGGAVRLCGTGERRRLNKQCLGSKVDRGNWKYVQMFDAGIQWQKGEGSGQTIGGR